MARGKGRGGYRAPSNPAAVSGPGALSQRTDGGAQPMRVPTGGDYGDATALRQQQQGAPIPQASGLPVPAGSAPPGRPADPNAIQDPFRPTERPGEPGTAGAPIGSGPSGGRLIPDDPDMLIRVFAEQLHRAGLDQHAARLNPFLRRG